MLSRLRKATYGLMGSGLHGTNGLNPLCCLKLIQCYVLPRAIYGSEVLPLIQAQKDKVNSAYCRILKQIQGLPLRAPNASTYLLLGTLPLEAQIDLRVLSLLGAIARCCNETLFSIALNLTSVKSHTSKSWFTRCEKVLIKYNLPSICDVLDSKPSKEEWKRVCKEAVNSLWTNQLQQEARTKSSLQFLNLADCSTRTPHACWASIGASAREVQKANTKIKLTVGTYLTMSNAHKFFKCDPICRLCYKEPETVSHIVLVCPALHEPRSRFVPELRSVLEEHNIPCTADNILQAALHATKFSQIPSTSYPSIESISVRLCFAVHSTRAYHLARAGHTFKRPRRKTLIYKQGAKTMAENSRRTEQNKSVAIGIG